MHGMKENERKMKTVVKEISRKIFRKIALESCPTIHLRGGPMTVSENYSAIHSEGCPIYLLKLSSKLSRTKTFCFQNCNFARIWLRHV